VSARAYSSLKTQDKKFIDGGMAWLECKNDPYAKRAPMECLYDAKEGSCDWRPLFYPECRRYCSGNPSSEIPGWDADKMQLDSDIQADCPGGTFEVECLKGCPAARSMFDCEVQEGRCEWVGSVPDCDEQAIVVKPDSNRSDYSSIRSSSGVVILPIHPNEGDSGRSSDLDIILPIPPPRIIPPGVDSDSDPEPELPPRPPKLPVRLPPLIKQDSVRDPSIVTPPERTVVPRPVHPIITRPIITHPKVPVCQPDIKCPDIPRYFDLDRSGHSLARDKPYKVTSLTRACGVGRLEVVCNDPFFHGVPPHNRVITTKAMFECAYPERGDTSRACKWKPVTADDGLPQDLESLQCAPIQCEADFDVLSDIEGQYAVDNFIDHSKNTPCTGRSATVRCADWCHSQPSRAVSCELNGDRCAWPSPDRAALPQCEPFAEAQDVSCSDWTCQKFVSSKCVEFLLECEDVAILIESQSTNFRIRTFEAFLSTYGDIRYREMADPDSIKILPTFTRKHRKDLPEFISVYVKGAMQEMGKAFTQAGAEIPTRKHVIRQGALYYFNQLATSKLAESMKEAKAKVVEINKDKARQGRLESDLVSDIMRLEAQLRSIEQQNLRKGKDKKAGTSVITGKISALRLNLAG